MQHEVAEATSRSVKGTVKKSCIDAAQLRPFGKAFLEFLEQHHENEGAGVVVSAITVFVVGKRVDGVLEHSRVIRQTRQMIKPPNGKRRLAVQGCWNDAFGGHGRMLQACPLEASHIVVSHGRPSHGSSNQISRFAHAVPRRLVPQKIANRIRDCLMIAEWNNYAPSVGK